VSAINPRVLLPLLVVVTAVGPLAMHIILPSMPGLQTVFATDYGTVQLALSVYLFGVAASQLAYGPLSDRFGRRPLLLAGLGLFVLGSLACLAAQTIEWLIAGRIVQALGGSAGMVLTRAIIRDLYDRNRAASMLAYVTMAMVVAPMMAPTIGGYLDDAVNWRAGFAFVASAGAIAFLFAAAKLPETHLEERVPVSITGLFGGFGTLLTIRRFYGYSMQVTFATSAFFAFLAGAPYVAVEIMGFSATDFGLAFIAISLMFMVGNFTAARISARLGVDTMLSLGALITVAGGAGLLAAAWLDAMSAATLFGFMGLIAMGNGLTMPNALAGAVSVAPRLVGAASGLTGFLQMMISALVSYVVGRIVYADPQTLGVAIFLCVIASAGAHVLFTLVLARRADAAAKIP
jgi:DHA1 family bicyclomycin/chloramphenicol resistance-like MFS transporter